VVAALPGMTPLTLRQFLSERASLSNDDAALAAALGEAKESAARQKSEAYRLLVRVRFANGRESAAEIVISLRAKEEPYQVLSWQSDVTPHPGGARRL
jgi:general secretion pathway protein K